VSCDLCFYCVEPRVREAIWR